MCLCFCGRSNYFEQHLDGHCIIKHPHSFVSSKHFLSSHSIGKLNDRKLTTNEWVNAILFRLHPNKCQATNFSFCFEKCVFWQLFRMWLTTRFEYTVVFWAMWWRWNCAREFQWCEQFKNPKQNVCHNIWTHEKSWKMKRCRTVYQWMNDGYPIRI